MLTEVCHCVRIQLAFLDDEFFFVWQRVKEIKAERGYEQQTNR